MENGGFDAIIGNPPFIGGQKITGAMGENIREWLIHIIAGGRRGSADYCAYFFLRAYALLRRGGTLGLLATNTIAQGNTREVGLDAMVRNGFTITRAIQSRSWPGNSANIEYAVVWGVKGSLPDGIARNCDGVAVSAISTLLEPQGRETGNPVPLKENEGVAFQGCIVLGSGFVITQDTARQWIHEDSRNAEVLFPYLNGKDLNSRPDCSASRWVIDFNDRSEQEAALFSLPYRHVLEYVKPERIHNSRKPRREFWWRFAENAKGMRYAIASLNEILVITLVSKVVMPVRMPSNQVFSHALGVFATDSFVTQAVLSSSMHQLWAINRASTLGTEIRYTPSDVFDTFPRPYRTAGLDEIGMELDQSRREIMERRQLGLTDLYNMVNNPDYADSADADVALLRDIHRRLDETVMDAYGWNDVPLHHGFHIYRKMTRWTVCPEARVEILDRLLEENHRRARLEAERKEQ